MSKKTRLIILLFCVACFLVIAPVLVAYSMGYRFDFEKMDVVATGGIYVRTFPAADQITIDSNISEKPGLFANSIFVQSLLPKSHSVSIKKDGYYDYSKTLQVKENQVTKLENVLLIKNKIVFSNITGNVDYFSVAPNNQNIITASALDKTTTFSYSSFDTLGTAALQKNFSVTQSGSIKNTKWSDDSLRALIEIENSGNAYYYFFDSTLQKPAATRLFYLDKNSKLVSFNPQNSLEIFYLNNKTLYLAKGNSALPVINNIVSFKISGTNITWLSAKGTLSNSDLSGKLISKISLSDFSVDPKKTYEIVSILGNTFLKEDDLLFEFNQNTKTFEAYIIPAITGYKILASPDNKNLIYYSQDKIYLHSEEKKDFNEIFSGDKIANLQWLNNDYIIFTSGNKIIISEIDYRGNINSVTLPQTATSTFFNPQDNKLYVLSDNSFLVSEKLTP